MKLGKHFGMQIMKFPQWKLWRFAKMAQIGRLLVWW